jgi:predicted ribonuclease toxin of YeeF-YezG toxin-antitoxin module
VTNSPKVEVPRPQLLARRSGALGPSSGGGVTKKPPSTPINAAASPAVKRWRAIVKTLTPELIKKAMAARKNNGGRPMMAALNKNLAAGRSGLVGERKEEAAATAGGATKKDFKVSAWLGQDLDMQTAGDN